MNKVPTDMNDQIEARVLAIYYASDKESAEVLSRILIKKYDGQYPLLIRCFTEDLDARITQL